MTTRPALAAATLLLGLGTAASAGPITQEEAQRQAQVLQGLEKALAAETTAAGKFAHLARAMKEEPAVDVRRRMLETALRIPGPEREAFLVNRLTTEQDAGLRSHAATMLGRLGSEKSLAPLAEVAANDRTTSIQVGDIGGRSSARRAATFALAELAARFPKVADEAAAKLRALRVADDPKDGEGLADARTQALYQVTGDAALLKPFFERLRSKDARERERGVVAFQFFKLKAAPAELVATLKDADADVRSWSALVLGEIGDPKTAATLMAIAGDGKERAEVRCNAVNSLGRMKAAAAAGLMEKLLTDPSPSVQANAAVALYRITDKKVVQFPKGYRAD